jgi:lysozyme family protein
MDKSIDAVLENILTREGWPEYTVHPNDKGGPTKGGITLRTLEAWRHRRCTRAELQRLTEGEALEILQRRYVETNGIDKIKSLTIQAQVIDDAVLSGPLIAVKDLQSAIGHIAIDGIIGEKTLAGMNTKSEKTLTTEIAITRTLRLIRHVRNNPDQIVFLVGWVQRSLSFLRQA